jgi:hypothetical protein
VGTGEDYELAFAVEGPPPAHAAGTPVTAVGRFVDGPPGCVLLRDAEGVHDITGIGFEHGRAAP